MLYLAALGLGILLVGLGVRQRKRDGLPIDSAYTSKLVWVSLGLGMAIGSMIIPSLWLFISWSLRGGSVEDNLPPGVDGRFLLVILVVGASMTLVYTFFGYRDHVFPYKVIGSELKLRPEDRPAEDDEVEPGRESR